MRFYNESAAGRRANHVSLGGYRWVVARRPPSTLWVLLKKAHSLKGLLLLFFFYSRPEGIPVHHNLSHSLKISLWQRSNIRTRHLISPPLLCFKKRSARLTCNSSFSSLLSAPKHNMSAPVSFPNKVCHSEALSQRTAITWKRPNKIDFKTLGPGFIVLPAEQTRTLDNVNNRKQLGAQRLTETKGGRETPNVLSC